MDATGLAAAAGPPGGAGRGRAGGWDAAGGEGGGGWGRAERGRKNSDAEE